MATLQKSTRQNSQTSTLFAEDSLVSHLVSQVNDADLKIQEAHSFLTSHGLSQKNGQQIFCSKTLRDCYLMTVEELLKPLSPRLQNWGIVSNGKCLTQRILESPKIGKESSLSDILEDSAADKYFLSPKMNKYILERLKQKKDGHKPKLVQRSRPQETSKQTTPSLLKIQLRRPSGLRTVRTVIIKPRSPKEL